MLNIIFSTLNVFYGIKRILNKQEKIPNEIRNILQSSHGIWASKHFIDYFLNLSCFASTHTTQSFDHTDTHIYIYTQA